MSVKLNGLSNNNSGNNGNSNGNGTNSGINNKNDDNNAAKLMIAAEMLTSQFNSSPNHAAANAGTTSNASAAILPPSSNPYNTINVIASMNSSPHASFPVALAQSPSTIGHKGKSVWALVSSQGINPVEKRESRRTTVDNPFKCPLCFKKFARKYGYSRHWKKYHGQNNPMPRVDVEFRFYCSCGRNYSNKDSLTQHMKQRGHSQVDLIYLIFDSFFFFGKKKFYTFQHS